ncbi:MAG: cobalt transporter CbiM [Deltaproteobacteria bacterium]|jgi:cobalt/nickel transport system permease protein|nr:cobalt transporter CbiM [Deltaproteobacteria bacterium]
MHISEGVLSPSILVAGAVITAAGVTVGVRKMKPEDIPKAAVLTSGFFVASLIQVPAGLTSLHLVLNGMLGLFLGILSYPCFLVALIFQAVLFQFGGLTTLGVNTFNMAAPAIVSFYLFRRIIQRDDRLLPAVGGFFAGFTSVLGGTFLIAACLSLSGEEFERAAQLVVLAHVPVMVIEGVITAMAVAFIKKLKPEVFEVDHAMEREKA